MLKMQALGYSISSISGYLGISRQAYYKRLDKGRNKTKLYESLEELVVGQRRLKSRVGLRVIYYKMGLKSLLGVNQYEEQMSVRGLALKPYRSYMKTTDSRGHHYKFANLISGKEIYSENRIIVGDISYYQCKSGLYYIFQFVDYYTLEMKGLLGSRTMEGINAERCLRQVFRYNNKRKYNHWLILHTDGGSQYRSDKFQEMLRRGQIRPSHARNCLENGLSERANGIIKNEYLIDYVVRSEKHLNTILSKIKYQINEVWPSKRLDYKTPKAFAQWTRGLNKKERPGKKIKEVRK